MKPADKVTGRKLAHSRNVQLYTNVPTELRDKVTAAAAKNFRNVSAEIAYRLDRSFEAEDGK